MLSSSSLDPHPSLQMAALLHAQGQLDPARAWYHRALKAQPRDARALQQLGLLESQAGQQEMAVHWFRQSLTLVPGDTATLNNLGYTLQQLGRLEEAQQAYEQALALDNQDADLLLNLGLLHKQQGRTAEALACFERILARDADHVPAWCNHGNVLDQQGEHHAALASYERALALAPDNVVVLCNMSHGLQALGRDAEALAHADRALALDVRHVRAWIERGNALRTLAQHAQAIASYQEALRLAPDHAQAHANLTGTLLSHDAEGKVALDAGMNSLRANLQLRLPRGPQRQTAWPAPLLRHDLQQALYLQEHDAPIAGLPEFIRTATELLQAHDPTHTSAQITVSARDQLRMAPYLGTAWVEPPPGHITHCLNPELDWDALQQAYLDSDPELVVIDDFLSPAAWLALRRFALGSRVWNRSYPRGYLGAFANQGFNSGLHLQLARELRQRMPRVFLDHALEQLWGFKYEAAVSRGINMHADFAKVNLNFWLTPGEFNLDPDSGGLKVYTLPAPADWTFSQYNSSSELIRAFLEQNQSGCITVPHRGNRALLFNSALFHETDHIHFAPGYESRRINMTYLFGKQLR